MTTKKLSFLALLLSFAVILGYVEAILPFSVGIPGIKLGLANYAVVLTLYLFSFKDALVITVLRTIIIGLLFGNLVMLIYSTSAAIISIILMSIMRKLNIFSLIGVSAIGGVIHNVTQLIIAFVMFSTKALLYYVPFLIIGGLVAGILIGILVKESLPGLTNIKNRYMGE